VVTAKLNLRTIHRSIRRRKATCRWSELRAQRFDLLVLRTAALFACLWLEHSTPAVADLAVELAPASASITDFPIKLGVPALSAEIQLRNSSSDALRYYRLGTQLARAGDSASRPATWKRITPPVNDDTIAAGTQVVLGLSANLPEVGVYETYIDSYGKNEHGIEVPDRRIRIVVTREADAVPSELMVDPKPAAETWPWNLEKRVYLLTLRNTSTKSLAFAAPSVVSFTRKSGDAQTSVGTIETPSLDSAACGKSLEAQKSCPIRLSLQNGLSPGEYMIDVGLAGVGGGWSQRTQSIRVRASAWLAFVIVVAGAAAGWYVQAWRTKGRIAVSALMDIARLREAAAERLVRADDDSKVLIRRAIEEIDDIEARVRRDVDATTDIERVRLWIRHLTGVTEIQQRFNKLSADEQNVLRAPRDAIMFAVANPTPTDDQRRALDNMILELGRDLGTSPRFVQSIAKANELLAAMESLLRVAGDPTDITELRAARDDLNHAVTAAKGSLVNGSLSARVVALDQALTTAGELADTAARKMSAHFGAATKGQYDALGDADNKKKRVKAVLDDLDAWTNDMAGKSVSARLQDLAHIFSEVGGKQEAASPVAASPIPTPDFPTQSLLPGWGSSLTKLQSNLKRNEILTNCLILIAAGASGVLTLWVPDPTWGSVGDVIGAFLAGLAARMVVGEVGSANQATGAVR
jgi:hypothetical protein